MGCWMATHTHPLSHTHTRALHRAAHCVGTACRPDWAAPLQWQAAVSGRWRPNTCGSAPAGRGRVGWWWVCAATGV